ncbi:putrescine-binding periplasmic protein precursor [Pleomorphomonas sp. SM30]|uniref:Putrescine-binding periplasmic protein n=2 Tax=Oharaeibacter diazotrophicus TaxID=1920512 RepID=A0A4R6RHN2_9HYPH|nr:putrescine transport system substrate-binding protein [Oharaeibacter diazotrophicus]BBE74317.1 putrescine-binding periplasmic protein precursor [Pleomorphomonas sp. SM30]GLS75992.1 putrescine-binding periplasmic protein [Oharaeibacter diazotrophicus]
MSQIRNTVLAGVAAVMLGVGGAAAEDRVVNVYNWSDYIDPTILEDFTKETGIKVVYDVFDSNELVETKLLAGGSGYDVVVPTGPFLARQITAGVFQKLDKAKLPNLVNVWPDIAARLAKYDPGNEYAVNYMWGTTGIGLNVDKIKAIAPDAPVDSLKMIFDPAWAAKFKDCGISVLDAPDETLAIAMNYLGKDPDSKDPADLEAAGELWKSVAPYIQKFNSSAYIDALANGDICLALGWSGDVLQAATRAEEAKNGVKVDYHIPVEGTYMWFDNLAIPADAQHVDEAHAFINYLLKPEVIAKASNYVAYANGNLASQQFIDKAIIDNPAVYPPADVVKRLFTISPYDPKSQRVLTRVWTAVKTGS